MSAEKIGKVGNATAHTFVHTRCDVCTHTGTHAHAHAQDTTCSLSLNLFTLVARRHNTQCSYIQHKHAQWLPSCAVAVVARARVCSVS
eukprot:m.505983 g.505983  ORF g.505983 m.505983 type:complete len:88 (-) comp80389_c0_seq1:36-299(-)